MRQGDRLPLEAQIIEPLRTCFDPPIPVTIYALGLIYRLDIASSGAAPICMPV